MRANGFTVRIFSSIAEYLEEQNVADKWYFTRPQLERMGERVLRKQDELRESHYLSAGRIGKIQAGHPFLSSAAPPTSIIRLFRRFWTILR